MAATFERVRRPRRGYSVEQVDEFFAHAREQFESNAIPPVLTSEQIRRAGFDLERGGYRIPVVDASLERLEDTFAERERQVRVVVLGEEQWREEVRDQARVVLARAQRPRRERFARVTGMRIGYSMDDVDSLCDQIADYLVKGTPLTAGQVRAAIFRRQWRGYSEPQVDAVLDRVVEIMLAAR